MLRNINKCRGDLTDVPAETKTLVEGGSQQLNSPWDLALSASGEELYIAMAGQHQIWKCYLRNGACVAFSGNGAERNQNGESGATTSWAQPSGISLSSDGRSLCVLSPVILLSNFIKKNSGYFKPINTSYDAKNKQCSG